MSNATYGHTCDASAAVRIDGTDLFVGASDEDSILRTYNVSTPGPPTAVIDVTTFLEPDSDDTESDLEGAAVIGDRIYWIGSHGRSKKGKEKKIRQRLFATQILRRDGQVQLQPVGKPYKRLLAALTSAPDLAALNLAAASEKKPEEDGGFNIEGLAPTREGDLILGLRNPIREGRTAVIKLFEPARLIADPDATARLTLAGMLNLGGRGIRALEFVPSLGLYLVLAGAFDDSGNFALFGWSGDAAAPAVPMDADMGGLNPEELILLDVFGSHLSIRLLSDDGTDECKAAAPEARGFRSLVMEVELAS